ncbi:MAG TPA: hypothetical protein VIL69_10015, partial [Roseomonas sp.]
MRRSGLNALVLHESDLVHHVVYPRTLFDPHALWRDAPSRRGENAIFNNRTYLASVLAMAREAGIAVWVNVKEIGFSDEVLAVHPEVFKQGAICPSEPFWMGYVEAKTDELFADFPDLAGVIVSFGSQESRASRAQNRCRCQLCAEEPLEGWYGRLIQAMHGPAARHGRRLAVRDFAYKPSDHLPLIEAMRKAPGDVIFCIKAMPHDFYLTFPDNPALGAVGREQWVEYDCLGQFFGWGIMPCFVLDDLAERMPRWKAGGATGVILRIEWERINDLDALDNLAELNLIAGAALALGEAVDAREVCRRWLLSHGHAADAAPWLAKMMQETAPIVRRAAYVNGFVSADNSMLPRSIARAWWGAEVRDSLIPWAPERDGELTIDRMKLTRYLAEKDAALAEAEALLDRMRNGEPGLAPSVHALVLGAFAHFVTWVEGLRLTARVCLHARFLKQGEDAAEEDRRALAEDIEAVEAYASRVRGLAKNPAVPHQVVMLVDHRRALDVAREGHQILGTLSATCTAM